MIYCELLGTKTHRSIGNVNAGVSPFKLPAEDTILRASSNPVGFLG